MKEYTTLEEAVNLVGYNLNIDMKISHLKDIYKPISYFDKASSKEEYLLPISKLNTLVSHHRIRTVEKDGRLLLSCYDIAKFILQQRVISESYYYFIEFFKMNGATVKRGIPKLYHSVISSLSKAKLIDVIELSPLDSLGKMNKFITKESTNGFFEKYVSIQNIINEHGISNEVMNNKILDMTERIVVHNVGRKYSLKFVKRTEFEQYRKEYMFYSTELISELSIGKEIGLSQQAIEKVIEEYNLKPQLISGKAKVGKSRNFSGRKFYNEATLDFLKKEQRKLWAYYTKNYYTSKEVDNLVKNELGINSPSREIFSSSYFNTYREDKVTRIAPPPLVRIEKSERSFKAINSLYKKEIINQYIADMKFEKEYVAISETYISQPLLAYQRTIQHLGVDFPKEGEETKGLWEYFVKWVLENKDNGRTLVRAIRDHAQTAKFLSELLKASRKNIGLMTTKEIKIAIFNKNIKVYQQAIIYSFLYNLQSYYFGQGKKVFYSLDTITNPSHSGNNPNTKTIYSEEEYGAYIDYVTQQEVHKKRAIEDIEYLIKGEKNKYKSYASTWLYILIHLNNKWRRFEATLFPSFGKSIHQTLLMKRCNYNYEQALIYLKTNNLDHEDVEYIAYKLKAFRAIHNKNKQERDFTWTNKTALALATSIILCELRIQLVGENNLMLIDFNSKNRQLPEGSEKEFFKEFKEDIQFSSRKMNATLSSLGYLASRRLGHEAVMETIRSFRNHKLDQSTNIYLHLPEKRITEIVSDLFNAGPFGFVHSCLTEIIYGKSNNTNKALLFVEKNEFSRELANVFGDWISIEEVIRTFDELSKNQHIVKEVLRSKEKNELLKIQEKINLGINYAKEDGFMCIFDECIYEDKGCITCPFMSMNFHTLTVLGEEFTKLIDQCELKFRNKVDFLQGEAEVPQAERLRLTRLLTIYSLHVREAIQKFGEDIVSMFFETDLDAIRSKVKTIPSVANYKRILQQIDGFNIGEKI